MTSFTKSSRVWPAATLVFVLISIGLLIALIVVVTNDDNVSCDNGGVNGVSKVVDDVAECGDKNPNGNFIDLREPEDPGPFHDLTVTELKGLRRFLENDPNIKAAKSSTASINSSYLFMADLFVSKKVDVLNFLDQNGQQPTRQARVLMFRGDKSPPINEEYICGPLPDVTECKLLSAVHRRNPVEFSLRPIYSKEFQAIRQTLFKEVDRQIGYILRESFGLTFTDDNGGDTLDFIPAPIGTALVGDINTRLMWLTGTYNLPFPILHPIDVALLCDLGSAIASEWSIAKVWYAGRTYDSMDELILGYNSSSIPTVKMTKPEYSDQLFSTLQRRGEYMPPKPQRPPTVVEPDGKRYSVRGRKVDYMGWTFNFRMSPLSGPTVYDVRYKDERIAYEVGLADIAVFYSGYSPLAQTTDYMDSGVLIGSHSKSLVPGADCPESATLINQTFLNQYDDEPGVYDATFCLFEINNGYPLRRHLSYTFNEGSFYGGMLDSVLTLRSIMTIGNYDYTVDYIFHQNGVVETRFMSTGYIQSNYYRDEERDYGFKIEKGIIGNIHHHMAQFKIDLDIGGTSNRYETLDISQEFTNVTWNTSIPYYQTKYTRSLATTEMESVYDFNFWKPRYHVVHNNDKKTNFDEIKAYRIQMNGMSPNLVPTGIGNEPSASWARHQLVATRHKDDEFSSNSVYQMFDSADPVVKFNQFYEDNDTIVDQDLVFWLSLGLHHIPHTEDIPVTPTVGNHLSIFLLPYNYFRECPSMGSRDSMYVQHVDAKDPTKGVKVERYGNSRTQCVIPRPTLEEDVVANPDQVLESRRLNPADKK